MSFNRMIWAPGTLALCLLSACGGTTQSDTPQATSTASPQLLATTVSSRKVSGGSELSTLATPSPMATTTTVTPAAASHLLAQASFGPTMTSISDVVTRGPAGWIDYQFTLPLTSHRNHLIQMTTLLGGTNKITPNHFYESFWQQAATGNDQLRQRVTFALSQIFVVSGVDTNIGARPFGMAGYYDTLNQNAFGNFRDLLQAVALHPMMGMYLSHMHNQKEDGTRVPDENFAREIMQLMTIGLYQLNPDGTLKTSNGKPIETYSRTDVEGLAKVFTGWSWYGPDKSTLRFLGGVPDPSRDWMPMQSYPAFHSSADKQFLGVSISGATSPEADLKVALDTLFMHPNVGPFIGRQLIQRLVNSNPSPAYVGRVAAKFNDNGSGVRGDMKAVVRAVLLDPEAAAVGVKLREPVIRLANWMRAFNARSVSGRFQMPSVDDPLNGLAQNPMLSPSVFNFYRPGFTPPNTTLSAAGLASPEMQITSEPSVTGYLNFMRVTVPHGTGPYNDIQPDYSAEFALGLQQDALLDRMNLLLFNGSMSSTLRARLLGALNAVPTGDLSKASTALIDNVRWNRVWLAVFLSMASPEYLVQ